MNTSTEVFRESTNLQRSSGLLVITLIFGESNKPPKMPVDFSGTWDIVSMDNFEGYMIALDIDSETRKLVSTMRPQTVIQQDGDCFTIKTLNGAINHEYSFKIGEEFKEKCMDNRLCQTVVSWENDKLVCVQKGEKKNRGWTHWFEADRLHLEFTCEDQVCKIIYGRTPQTS